MEAATGTVVSLHRWPVKSLGGEDAGALRLDRHGVAGDRAHAIVERHKGAPRRLTARQAPRMLAWSASYPDHPGDSLAPGEIPPARLTSPDGTHWSWDDPALAQALADDLQRPVALDRDLTLMQDVDDSVLVTSTATHAAVERELGRTLDLRRFRTNIHVEWDDATPAYAEEGWEGRTLVVGETGLLLLQPCVRCVIPTRDPDTQERDAEILRWLTRHHAGIFGIYARATGPGRVAIGDRVGLR